MPDQQFVPTYLTAKEVIINHALSRPKLRPETPEEVQATFNNYLKSDADCRFWHRRIYIALWLLLGTIPLLIIEIALWHPEKKACLTLAYFILVLFFFILSILKKADAIDEAAKGFFSNFPQYIQYCAQ